MSLEDEKEVSKIIYWNWAEETGDTEEEIHENDLKDSEFMGKKLQMAISVTGKQVMSENNNYYMVTLDANGGKIGSSSSVQKQVIGGESYGELPTPTREGYTFMGWNGKNLINIDEATNEALIDNGDETYTMWYNNMGRYGNKLNVNIPENVTINVSYDLLEYNGTYLAPLQIVAYPSKGDVIYFSKGRFFVNKNIANMFIYQEGTQPVGTYTRFKNLQLEIGSTATEYEPYYLSPSTKVTQTKNHTLTAIWRKNEN